MNRRYPYFEAAVRRATARTAYRYSAPAPSFPQLPAVRPRPRPVYREATADNVIELVWRTGGAVARGREAVAAVRAAIHQVMRVADLRLEFDPRSDPRWVDYLVCGLVGAAEGAAVGYGVGLALGALFAMPLLPFVGLLGGAVVGGMQGVHAASIGWRVRVGFDVYDEPFAVVEAFAA